MLGLVRVLAESSVTKEMDDLPSENEYEDTVTVPQLVRIERVTTGRFALKLRMSLKCFGSGSIECLPEASIGCIGRVARVTRVQDVTHCVKPDVKPWERALHAGSRHL